jgi:hypothetical protein
MPGSTMGAETLRPDHAAMPALRPLLTRRPVAPAAASAIVLDVTFSSPTGGSSRAIGGGATFADAVEFARSSLPAGHDWRLADWRDLYGE